MSVTTRNTQVVGDPQPPDACSLCGSPMAADQEWCLECGAARTVIARAPDWRVPVLVIATVVLLVAGGLVLALVSLSHNAGKVTVVNAGTPNGGTSAAAVGSWAPGSDGYTVLLQYETTQAAATADAKALLASRIQGVGVISTAAHPVMKPANVFYVFVGRFPSYQTAQVKQKALLKAGQTRAKVALVQKPGGS